jgi:hypothetical protein
MAGGSTFSLMRQLGERLYQMGGAAWRRWQAGVVALWALAMPVLLRALEFLLALLIVFEEWGWRPLADLLGWLARWRPWAGLEARIMNLPPYLALVVFALPSLLLVPLKFLALVLIAGGHVMLAGLLFILAKVVATALIARLFLLTQPALMQIGWFASAYDRVMPWKEALVARVHASWAWRLGRRVKAGILQRWSTLWAPWRPSALAIEAWARRAGAKWAARVRERFGEARRWLARTGSR